MDVEDARTIGQRLREIRCWRDKWLRVVAELTGSPSPTCRGWSGMKARWIGGPS
jgi:hypothetical protein